MQSSRYVVTCEDLLSHLLGCTCVAFGEYMLLLVSRNRRDLKYTEL
jgi:hypothetical protein